jgi:regulator of nonsense transcripts 1
MDGFNSVGNHLVSDSASTINAGEDESILDGRLAAFGAGARRRRNDDDDETDVFDDDDMESMASHAVDGANGNVPAKVEEEVQLPPHACA